MPKEEPLDFSPYKAGLPVWAYRVAEQSRNKVNHLRVERSVEDCPKRAAFLNELAEKRKKARKSQSPL
jgi:hypothetical protein